MVSIKTKTQLGRPNRLIWVCSLKNVYSLLQIIRGKSDQLSQIGIFFFVWFLLGHLYRHTEISQNVKNK